MARAPWANASIYEVGELFVDRCLKRDDSLFTPGRPIWTGDAAKAVETRIAPAPPIQGSFIDKFHWQLELLDPVAAQLGVELLYMVLLPESDTSGAKKREHLGGSLELLPEAIEIPAELDRALDGDGVANYGQAKNRRDLFVRALATFIIAWKDQTETERDAALSDPRAFREVVESLRLPQAGMQSEALLHLVFPDTFEYALAPEHKRKIAQTFAAVPDVAQADDVDRQLAAVRTAVAPILGPNFNLYRDSFKNVWESAEPSAWQDFLSWARRVYEWDRFDEEERDYKIEIAERLQDARAATQSDAEDWVALLGRAFGSPNNLTSHWAHAPLLRWCADSPQVARKQLLDLWSSDPTVPVLSRFVEGLPAAISGPGNRLSLTSFLLMAIDATRYPVFRARPYERARGLLGLEGSTASGEIDMARGYEPEDLAVRLGVSAKALRDFLRREFPRPNEAKGQRYWALPREQVEAIVAQFGRKLSAPDVIAERYFAFLDLLDELAVRLLAGGTSLRDRLDAQGLLWWVTSAAAPEEWADDDRRAFEAYQAGEGDAVDHKDEPGDGEAEIVRTLPKKAWLVRGANSGGENLIPQWLAENFVSIGWAEAGELDPSASRDEVSARLQDAYPDDPAGGLANSVGNLVRFLRQIEPGDLVLTTDGPNLWVGRVLGPATWAGDDQKGKARRREVEWLNETAPILRADVKVTAPTLYSKLRTLLTVTDLKEDVATLASLVGLTPPPPRIEAQVPASSIALAEDLFVTRAWLDEIIDLLNEKRQVIFYGPPGTGKTYIAQALGEHIEAAGGESRLVQFHPSYAYEDFFEGYRPMSTGADSLSFRLTPGPLRLVADEARQNPTKPYLLIVDEINRGNIAKIFGELYFLLEYRDRPVSLQYSPQEEFTLPPNLFVLGTMNTADRSIALVDSALRRRFYFVPFLPTEEPLRGVLEQWLEREGLDPEPAILLNRLNEAIGATEFSIGSAYFMAARGEDGVDLDRVWRYAIRPLLEEHYYGTGRNIDQFSFEALRQRAAVADVDAQLTEPEGE